MRALAWITCLWPGLAALWVRGRWGGLATAAALAVVLNFALLATFAGELLPRIGISPWTTAAAAWALVLGFWALGICWERGGPSGRQATPPAPHIDDWLREAQAEYLKGHWIESETILFRLLADAPEDVEARLLLASIQRRTRRLAEARTILSEIGSHESAPWMPEIQSELARITAAEAEQGEVLVKNDNTLPARAA